MARRITLTERERSFIPILGVRWTEGLRRQEAYDAARRIEIATRRDEHPCDCTVSQDVADGTFTLKVRNW